jgi:heme exporter protein D
MNLGPHADFIIWSYVGAAVCVVALIGYAVIEAQRVRGRLKTLEARGIRRRSAGASQP